MGRQAVLPLLRAGGDARRTTRPVEWPSRTAAPSTTAGTCCASGSSPTRRSWGSSPPTRADLKARRDPRVGRHPEELRPSSRGRWSCTRRPRAHRPPHRPPDRRAAGLGILDDTLVMYIVGDNGASARGRDHGTFNADAVHERAAALETPDSLGAPRCVRHARGVQPLTRVGWAWAMGKPYQWTKQVASHWGGTRNGTIVHWPASIAAEGGLRHHFHHVIDVAPRCSRPRASPSPRSCTGSCSRRWRA